ncbi:MAG TPA: class I SAM-dependent methyltransferase [Jatrophihabitantaceae bacterium]|jgi:ubiquinone/menaquinone biosynthesis C-methylase UbiE|nr:class I SAM-dependent methyltransferase [Jatrophihabitantaceae bacterium]
MGCYTDHLLPRLMNTAGDRQGVRLLRRRVCDGLSGTVVEIGFGSGLNVPYYPQTVTSVTAVEPSDVAWKLARERIQASGIPVSRTGLDGESLPFPDDSYDAALSTWTLCTIPDVAVALGEVRRVLKPGGSLHFLEHGLAPDEKVRRWQRRLEPIQKRLAGGCHLTRTIVDLLDAAGFVTKDLDVFYEYGAPRSVGACSLGRAFSP